MEKTRKAAWGMGALVFSAGVAALAYAPVNDTLPRLIPYDGFLESNGLPLAGSADFTFRLFTADTGGTEAWSESQSVPVADGRFSVRLGSINALPESVFTADTLYLAVEVNSAPLAGRQRILAMPYAIRAAEAQAFRVRQSLSVDGALGVGGTATVDGAISGASLGVTGTVTAGNVSATTVTGGTVTATTAQAGTLTADSATITNLALDRGFCVDKRRNVACPTGFTQRESVLYYGPTSFWCNTASPGTDPELRCGYDGASYFAASVHCCR